jgi:hydrogenase maturation protein HypF
LAEENGWQLFQVQHHYAHIAALMIEHSVEEIVGICCDGYGYGINGEAWGGEILLCTRESSDFKRVAHLEKQPLIGGDLATRFPLRMATGMLHKRVDVASWLLQNKTHFPHGESEIQLILNQLEKSNNIIETTSCGRVLDATAAVLGVCYERTYEGEPAMKLESAALKGKDVIKLEPIIKSNTLDTTQMLLEIFENREKYSKTDLAYSLHSYLARGLAELAIENAEDNGIRTVGFSGGAACNQILTSIMRKAVKTAGLQFLVHEAIPPGDGGVSFGQAVVGGFFQV